MTVFWSVVALLLGGALLMLLPPLWRSRATAEAVTSVAQPMTTKRSLVTSSPSERASSSESASRSMRQRSRTSGTRPAATTGSATDGAVLMLLFGAGTVPALMAVRLGGSLLSAGWRGKLRRLSPVVIGAMGLLLILRGSRLDIPYVSPAVPMAAHTVTDCR